MLPAALKPTAVGVPVISHPAAKHGLPASEQLRIFQGYVSSFDPRTRNPQYVLEHITRNSASGEGNRYVWARMNLCIRMLVRECAIVLVCMRADLSHDY